MCGHPRNYVRKSMEALLASNALWQTAVAGGEGWEPDDNCENPGALPPFPTWEGVLATEIGEPGRTDGGDFWSAAADWEIRSITSVSAVALPDFEMDICASIFCSNLEIASAWARACMQTAIS